MAITLGLLSIIIAAGALLLSLLSYLARNRPYVGVEGLDASKHLGNDQIELAIEVRNVGEIPAVDVTLSVSDSGGQIDLGDIYLGPLFSHTTVQIRQRAELLSSTVGRTSR